MTLIVKKKVKYAKVKDRSGHVKHKLAIKAVKEQEAAHEIATAKQNIR